MNDLIVEKVFPFLKFEKRRKESPFNFNFSKIFVFEHPLPTHSQLLSRDTILNLSQISLSSFVSMISIRMARLPLQKKDFREGNESFFNEREKVDRRIVGIHFSQRCRFEPNRFDRSSSKIVASAQWPFQSVASDRNLPLFLWNTTLTLSCSTEPSRLSR